MAKMPTPSPSRKRAGSNKRKVVPVLVRRQRAIEAVQAKYAGRGFDWKTKATCLHLWRFHMRMLGNRLPALPQIGSLLAAKRALAERGWADVSGMLDALKFERIAPAAAWLGDLAVFPSEDGMGSIAIFVSPRKVLGWHDGAGALVVVDIDPGEIAAAFRV